MDPDPAFFVSDLQDINKKLLPLTNGDPDPAIFVSDLQDINKKLFFFLSFLLICF
jgi:hypothetical protein